MDIGSYNTGMEWETTPEARVASTSGTYAKRVSKDVIEARRSKGLCLRCGNSGHRIRDCTFLPPTRPEVKVFTARAGEISLNRSQKSGISASRAR
jgi:adenine-specific DNA methylase